MKIPSPVAEKTVVVREVAGAPIPTPMSGRPSEPAMVTNPDKPPPTDVPVPPTTPMAGKVHDYGQSIQNTGDVPTEFMQEVVKLCAAFVEADRLGEQPNIDVFRRRVADAAKRAGMPDTPVITVP